MKWYPFTDVVTDVTSKFNKVQTSVYKSQGLYKIIDQGKEPVAGYTDDERLVNAELCPIIVFGDHTRIIKYEDTPIVLGADGAKALKVNSRLATTLYVYYYLRSVKLKAAGYSRHFKFLKEIQIPIPLINGEPNLDDQKRIAHLLSKVEGLIAQRKQHLQQLDALRRSVFLELFGDPVLNEKGWEKKPLDKLGSLDRGVSKHRPRNAPELLGGKYPLIQTGDVSNSGTYITSYNQTYSEIGFAQSKLWPRGTLCITIAANIAQTGILTLDACFPDSVVGFCADKNQSNTLYVHVLFGFFQQILEKNAPQAAQKNINLEILRNLLVPAPPIDLQNLFAAIVEKVESIKTRYQQSLTELENLYGTLSQKAFKGELDLSRVVVTKEQKEAQETIETNISTVTEAAPNLTIELPTPADVAKLTDAEGRMEVIGLWLDSYLEQQGGMSFSAQDFMESAKQKLWELLEDDAYQLSVAEYDHMKNLVFQAFESGRLTQTYDGANNRVQITAVRG